MKRKRYEKKNTGKDRTRSFMIIKEIKEKKNKKLEGDIQGIAT